MTEYWDDHESLGKLLFCLELHFLSSFDKTVTLVYQENRFLAVAVKPLQQPEGHLFILNTISSSPQVKVKNVISAVNAAQNLINNNASQVIVQETKEYMDTIIGYFEQYIEWVKESVAMEVAACKPIANVIDTAVDIFLCSYIADSVNTFWFGLGGSSMFLIPAIIFAVKLSKYYRRMDTEDVYDDSVEQW